MELAGRTIESPERVFETTNVDLGAYLMREGLPYLGSRLEMDPNKRRLIAVLQFLDERLVARDLERVFAMSSEKQYRDLTKYLLREVHKEIRRFNGTTDED